MHETAISLPVILPEVVLAVGILALVLYGAVRGERGEGVVNELAVGLLGLVFIMMVATNRPMGVTFYGSFIDDAFTRFMSALALIGSLVTLLLSVEFMRQERIGGFEFPVLILISTLGMLMLIAANDFIALYLGFELMSLALYVIATYRRHDLRATEAGLKYFVLGALSSGMMLYGMSLIYGYAGSVAFGAVANAVHDHAHIGVLFGLVFLLVGLAFKISVVPFHMWTPDVYEGAPTPVTTFFASAPKIAAMAVLVRVMVTAFPGIANDWRQIITFVSIASMALGAFAGIGQRNFKRLMAYSSIGHMGYALVGLAAGTVEGAQSVAIYMAIYVVMTLGTFAAILSMRRDGHAVETMSDLAGLARTNPSMAFFLATMMFSLAGIPPLAGFFAKFYVFAAAIKAGLYGLSVIGVLASAVAAYYYLRIVKLMYFDEPAPAFDPPTPVARIVLAMSALAIILFVFAPLPITNAAMAAAQSLFLSAASGLDSSHRDWRVVRFSAIDSTNEEARRRAFAGDTDRQWIVADEQTIGRGRRGRTWISPKGNLHASALMIDPCPRSVAAQLSFVAAVALARAASDLGATDVGLKWPNDLMSRGAKCAGILIEGFSLGSGRTACVVGIGVNCAHAPEAVGYSTSCLKRAGGQAVTPGEVFAHLIERFDDALHEWRAGQSFDGIRTAWLDYAVGVGERIVIQNGAGKREGVFEGVDPSGRLLMRSGHGLDAIEAGDVWLLPHSGIQPRMIAPVSHSPEGRA